MGPKINHHLGLIMAKNYTDITKVKSNFKKVLVIIEFIFEIIGFSRPQNFQKDFWQEVTNQFFEAFCLNSFATINRLHHMIIINLSFFFKDHTFPFISQQYMPLCRTGIYRRDLVRANEPVVHDKHQPCNSNCLQCPIYALRHAIQWRRPFFWRQNNKSQEILLIIDRTCRRATATHDLFYRDSVFSYTIYSA